VPSVVASNSEEATNKVCLVLGAGAGVGQAVARRFAQEGFHVCCVRRGGGAKSLVGEEGRGRLETFCEQLRADFGVGATALFADMTNPDDVKALIGRVEAEIGPIEVAVYNVGAQVGFRNLERTSYRIFEQAWRMGALGAFSMAKELAPFMLARGRGTLLYTSATAALRGNQGQHAHTSAMAGRRMLCQSLSHELGRQGIHVCHVVLDGPVNAPDTLGRMFPGMLDQLPADKILQPVSIAETYLALHRQSRNAWTLELDLRASGETAWFNT